MARINIQPEVGETIGGQPVNSGMLNPVNKKNSENGRTIMSTDVPGKKDKKSNEANKPELSETPKKKSRWWIWLIIILILVGAGIAAYFLILKDKINLF